MKPLTGICIALLAGVSVAGCSPESTTTGDSPATSQTTPSDDRASSQASTNDRGESPPIVQSPTTEPSTTSDMTTSDMTQQARVFEVLDQDRDGYVSKLEASDRVDDYDQADANNDGRLDRQEFSAIELKDIDDNASTPTPTQP
jgi:hypothetical protein